MTSRSLSLLGLQERFRIALNPSSFRARVIQGGGALVLADLYSNGIRLVGNLVLTRLLFPEAFGLMLIVNLVFTALEMLSDVGLRGSIIVRKEKIDEPFMNAVWTLGAIRGVLLTILALSLAGPIASYYGKEELYGLLLLAGIAPVIMGCASIAPILMEKQVNFGRVIVWRCLTQTLSLVVLIGWLLIEPTIYALAANGIVAAVIGVIGSYALFSGHRPRLVWDKEIALVVFRRGRWIFIATGMTFLARQGDGLILSHWVSTAQLGIFSVAIGFAKLVETLVDRLGYSLLFPVYAEIRKNSAEKFATQLRKVRLTLFAITAPIVLIFALFGQDLVTLLYDPRFVSAGWMLQVMAAGSAFYAVGAAIMSVPLAFDDARRHMFLQMARFTILMVVMYVGGSWAGLPGLVGGIAVAQVLFLPILIIGTARYKVHDYLLDGLYLVALSTIILTVWSLRGWPI